MTRTSPIWLPALVFFLMVPISAQCAIKYGLWEITTTTKMHNMPMPMDIPPMTIKQCVKKENAAPKPGGDCTFKQMKKTANSIKWQISCPRGMKGHGHVIYKGKTMSGESVISGPMASHSKIHGKYLGPCK